MIRTHAKALPPCEPEQDHVDRLQAIPYRFVAGRAEASALGQIHTEDEKVLGTFRELVNERLQELAKRTLDVVVGSVGFTRREVDSQIQKLEAQGLFVRNRVFERLTLAGFFEQGPSLS